MRPYLDVAEPSFVSYDHYQFAKRGDDRGCFLNRMTIRRP